MSAIQPTQLARRITLPLLVLYGLGVTIGAGIYVLIGLTIEEAGIYAPTAFIASAIVMGFTAASFIELSGRYPQSAAEAIYVEKSFGWSWLTILTGGSIAVAAIVAAAAISVGSAGYIQHLIDLPEPLIVSALILLMGLLAVYGILESVVFAGILTAIELSGLLAIIGIGLWVHPEVLEQLPDVIPSFNDNSAMIAIFSTVLIAFFAFIGFDDVVNLVEEVRNPTKVMPIGIVVTLVVVTVLYFLVVAIAVLVIPNQELIECDEDSDGLSTFNLFSITSKITNPTLNEELFFYVSQNDLENEIPITNPENFQNTKQNQEIFVKVVNNNGCSETTSFIITARFVDLANIKNFYVCENSDGIVGDSKGLFDSEYLASSIRNQLNIPNSTLLSFYPTYLDAQTNLNEFESNFTYTSGTIYVKAQEADLSCGGIQKFTIIVNTTPPINIKESYTICFNPSAKPPVIVSANTFNDRFEWRNANGTVLSTNQDFELNQVEQFSLTVYKIENGIECSNTKVFEVVNPPMATFGDIIVNTEDEKNNTISITVEGNSSYEFSLNNIDFFGDSNSYFFSNVAAGLQTIYVRDKNNCEQSIAQKVPVIGFKKYFTPNGDGNNDFWNIKGLDKTSFKTIDVKIFNRYGKLLYSIIDFENLGWNGMYNGKKLPENNYWFKALIIDNENNEIYETGNFSLIRD